MSVLQPWRQPWRQSAADGQKRADGGDLRFHVSSAQFDFLYTKNIKYGLI